MLCETERESTYHGTRYQPGTVLVLVYGHGHLNSAPSDSTSEVRQRTETINTSQTKEDRDDFLIKLHDFTFSLYFDLAA